MANIIEKTGKSYNIFDKVNNVWNKISFWHKASDCEFNDGKNAQTKLGAINGITSDLSGEAEDVAASIKCVNQLNSSLADGQISFSVVDGEPYVKVGADTPRPFKSEPKIYNGRKQWSGSVQVSSGNPSVTLTDSINVGSGKTIDGVYIRNAGIFAPAMNNPGSNNNGVIGISHSYDSETGIVYINIAVTWYTSTCKITDIDCSYTIIYH